MSAWSPLQYRVYRILWIALLASNIGTWMQAVGAAWMMVQLNASPAIVALVQTATYLPVVFVGRPGRRRRRHDRTAAPAPDHPGVHVRGGRRAGRVRGAGRRHPAPAARLHVRAGAGGDVQLPGLAGDPARAGACARAQAGGDAGRRQHQPRPRDRPGDRRPAHRRRRPVARVRAERRVVRLRARRALALEAPGRGGRRTARTLCRGGPRRRPLRHVLAHPARRAGPLVRVRRRQRRPDVAAARVCQPGARLGLRWSRPAVRRPWAPGRSRPPR